MPKKRSGSKQAGLDRSGLSDAQYAARIISPFDSPVLGDADLYPRAELWFSAALAALAGAGLHRADVGTAAVGRACVIADRLVAAYEERARQRPPFSKAPRRKG